MKLKFKRLSAYKKKRILELKEQGLQPKEIQRKLKITKSSYYYTVSPHVAEKARQRSAIARAKPGYKLKIYNKWSARKKEYQRWYHKTYHKKTLMWEKKSKRKARKKLKQLKIQENKLKLVEIAKRLGLYETSDTISR